MTTAEDIFRARIAVREQRKSQQRKEQARQDQEQKEQRIQELLPALAQAAKEAVKRLEAAGWPDWQGGELRQVLTPKGDMEERAVWQIVQLQYSKAYLGSNGIIYEGGETTNPNQLLGEFAWTKPEEVERVIRHLNGIQKKE